MHKYFIDWYKAAALQPSAEELERRWSAVEAFNKKIKLANALDIVRVFLGMPTAASDFAGRYSAAFQTADSAFSVRNNDLELRVLSAGSLAQILEGKPTNLADAVALAVISGHCKNLRTNILNAEIVDYAKKYLTNEAVRVREIERSFEIEELDIDVEDVLEALTAAAEGSNLAVLKEPLRPPFEKLSKAIADLGSTVKNLAEEFERVMNVQTERSEILWWTFAGYSQDLNQPVGALKASFAALVAGKELVDLVKEIPAPLACRAFLDKMLDFPGGKEPTSIADSISSANVDWKVKIAGDYPTAGMDGLYPLHVAIAKSLELDADNWPAAFEKATGLSATSPLPALDLSTQMCDERMLMRAQAAVTAN